MYIVARRWTGSKRGDATQRSAAQVFLEKAPSTRHFEFVPSDGNREEADRPIRLITGRWMQTQDSLLSRVVRRVVFHTYYFLHALPLNKKSGRGWPCAVAEGWRRLLVEFQDTPACRQGRHGQLGAKPGRVHCPGSTLGTKRASLGALLFWRARPPRPSSASTIP